MKISLQNTAVCLVLLTETFAFTTLQKNHFGSATATTLPMSKAKGEYLENSFKALGVAASIFAVSVTGEPALAETPNLFFSSSIEIAETIKTMDMSLPSSYDAISDVKKDSVAELSREENVLTGKITKSAPKVSTERMGFENLSDEEKKAKKEEAAAAKKAEKEIAAAAKAEAAAESRAEKAIADKEKAVAKKAKAEAKAKTEAKKEAKEIGRKYDEYEFVDTGLPSYGDSTIGAGRGKSAFSL
jgi:hypothetical protein